jgi:hypothetical protein
MMNKRILKPVILAACAAAVAATSCGNEEKEIDPRAVPPDFFCPGSEGCPDSGEERLLAGAAKADITPVIVDTFDDVDGNGDFDPPPMGEDVWHDNNGNGRWDFTWLAGFGNDRPANDVADPLWARAVVLRWRSTTVAVVALDLLGYFWDDVEDIREDVSDLDIDFVVVSAVHDHEAPDVIGIWGFDELTPGWDQAYIDRVRAGAAASIRKAYGAMAPARIAVGTAVPAHPERGLCNVVLDGRDPFILIEVMTTIRFVGADDGATIATLVNWAGHPESAGDENHSVTADYPRWLLEGVEGGVHRGSTNLEGVGGTALFIQGALGAQIGYPHRVTCQDLEGAVWPEHEANFGKVRCIGENLAVAALEAIRGESAPADACPLELRTKRVNLTVQNYAYQAMILNDIFHIHRRDYGFDRTKPISETNIPRFFTEVSWLRIGPAQAVIVPGELSPELAVGGYDGSHTPGCAYDWRIREGTVITEDNPNPPDISLAPGPPYLFDFLGDLGAAYPMVWGLADDNLGYFIPSYDYKLAEGGAYIEEAPGHHYEETNSIGPDGWPELERNLVGIMLYKP